jgi:hypothetical protein
MKKLLMFGLLLSLPISSMADGKKETTDISPNQMLYNSIVKAIEAQFDLQMEGADQSDYVCKAAILASDMITDPKSGVKAKGNLVHEFLISCLGDAEGEESP